MRKEVKRALDIEVDVSKQVEAEKPDLVVRLPRPRKYDGAPNTQSSEIIEKVSDPAYNATPQELYEHSQLTDDQAAAFASGDTDAIDEAMQTVDWGDYDVEKLVTALYTISEILTGIQLMPYQVPFVKRLYRSILLNDGETLTGLWSRQSGKSEATACAVVTLCVLMPALAKIFPEQLGTYRSGFWVGVYAPTGEQAHTLYSRILTRARSESASAIYEDPGISTSLEKYGARWTNGSFVFEQSASPQSSIESKTYHLIITDETQGLVEYMVSKSLEPMLAWSNGTLVHIGTTSENPCLFYDVIQKNRSMDINKPEKLRNHYEYDYEEIMRHNPRYKRHIEGQLKKHGVHSRFFQMSYCLRWFFEDGLAVSDRDLKDFTMHIPVDLTRYSSAPCVVGIDLAKKHNGSVVTVGQIMSTEMIYEDDEEASQGERISVVKLCDWLELEKIPYPQQRKMMKSFLEPYTDIRWITVDATGAGDPVFDEMCAEWNFTYNMEPFIFSPKSKNYLMNVFYEFLWKQRLLVPNVSAARKMARWQNFYLQMTSLERVTSHGYTYLARGHRENCRDDYADSLFLMLHAANMASKNTSIAEVGEHENLFRRERHTPQRGFEAIRRSVRNGTYHPAGAIRSARKDRTDKLIRGILTK